MTKNELKRLLNEEKKMYLGSTRKAVKQMKKSKHKRYFIYMYLCYFRLCQYYRDAKRRGKFPRKILYGFMFRHFNRLKNIYSYKSGVEIGLNSKIGKCCDIWHSNVVINGDIGDNCVFHGNNTVGNKGIGKEALRPSIGNNADIGAGAVIIGSISIADNCTIGAGAVVTKSFTESGSVIAGVPAKKLNKTEG